MLNKDTLSELNEVAIQAAKEAGQFILSQSGSEQKVQKKATGYSLASQVVTDIDIKSQAIILRYLQPSIQRYDIGLLAEERADDLSRLEKDFFWTIDPLDGTLAFSRQRSGYAVSIALVTQQGDPMLAVVYIPDLDACYSSIKASGVWLNDQRFYRRMTSDSSTLYIYEDLSLRSRPWYHHLRDYLHRYAADVGFKQVEHQVGFGAVRNAIAVIHAPHACYMKFPKPQQGGGSIWDFAATRLFFEELQLPVSTIRGKTLWLNDPSSTFMNKAGIVYATDASLAHTIRAYQPDDQ